MGYESCSRGTENREDMAMRMGCTSLHGYLRTMERAKKSGRQAVRYIKNAWFRGKGIHELQTFEQRRYALRHNSLLADGYTNLRIYDGYLFIFSSGGTLITMHSLPQYFFKKTCFDGKTKIRNAKKYMRLNEDVLEMDERLA